MPTKRAYANRLANTRTKEKDIGGCPESVTYDRVGEIPSMEEERHPRNL